MDFPWIFHGFHGFSQWILPMIGLSQWISHGFSPWDSWIRRQPDEARTILQHLSEAWRCWKANIPWKAPGASDEESSKKRCLKLEEVGQLRFLEDV